ncbi:MAG: TRAP transporter substrate-binding protein, partial [Bacteroidota bacterium]
MKFLRATLIILLAFLSSCKSQQEPEFLFRAALLVNEKHTWYQAFNYFSKRIGEESKGRIKLEVYPSEQLGKESEVIRMIQAGVLEMTTTGSVLNNWIEIAAFCELPFLLKDSTEMKSFIRGPIGQRLEREMQEICGLRPLGYFQRGPRHLTSNRPIRHPDDLKGMILRVPNVPSFVTAWAAMGAKPTPMAFSEVF